MAFEIVEGGYCLSSKDQVGDDHDRFSAEFVELSLYGVVSCGFCWGFGWDRRVVAKVDVCLGNFVATCSFRNVDDGMEWAFARVYGPNRDSYRRHLWEEFAGLLCLWEVPWCIRGDFNITLFQSERLGGARRRRAVAAFADFAA